MSAALVQRLLALAGIALLAGLGALAVASRRAESASERLPLRPIPTPDGGWYSDLAAAEGKRAEGRRSKCGYLITSETLGVAHPVLPCGIKLFIRYGERNVLTQVIDVGPRVPGRAFSLTRALAREMGLSGTQRIEWRFAA